MNTGCPGYSLIRGTGLNGQLHDVIYGMRRKYPGAQPKIIRHHTPQTLLWTSQGAGGYEGSLSPLKRYPMSYIKQPYTKSG